MDLEWCQEMNGSGSETVEPTEWMFSQVFGEMSAGDEVQEADIISAIEFDRTGDHLATGDRGGQVVLFERTDVHEASGNRKVLEKMDHATRSHPQFRFRIEFQSHEPEFDYLKSIEIQEKVNKIRWCPTANNAQFLLSTNDKTVKLWKVHEKKIKNVCEMNLDPLNSMGNDTGTNSMACTSNGSSSDDSSNDISVQPSDLHYLHLPKITSHGASPFTRCRRIYSQAHDYHINSLSTNSDGETFISADDLRINLWNMEINSQSFNIVDLKPANMEDLTEVITAAEFHPTQCNMLAFSSSKGSIHLIDLRQSALCDNHSKLFEAPETSGSRSFFTEILASISDFKFAKDGRHMLSRDYMTLKLWDINMDSGPVATFQVHEHIRPKLCDLYENDLIFDKFECCLSGDSRRVATGSYSNQFRVFGCTEGSTESTSLEASKKPMRISSPRSSGSLSNIPRRGRVVSYGVEETGGNTVVDFTSKLLHMAWHPTENLIACGVSNSLYMYTKYYA